MRITLSIPDPIAKKFQAAVPSRQRSRVVTALLTQELKRKEGVLKAACMAANRDRSLEKDIDEWQAFEDGFDE